MMFVSCTQTGEDGKAYISFTWEVIDSNYKVTSYSDDNPNTPVGNQLNENEFYETLPGTYNFEYKVLSNGELYSYSGKYTITVNKGEPGGIASNGADGEDIYYILSLKVWHSATTFKKLRN